MTNAITIEHVNKVYDGKVTALKDVSFNVEEGEVFGLVGPDGAGKSTLFNILTTLLLPDSGKISLLGMDVINEYKSVRQIIGYLPGVFSLYPDLSVEENLRFFAVMDKSSIEENMELIRPIWKQISPFSDRKAGKLSGGMKQKLALCCALIHCPKILFLDEPTTGVDPVSRKEFWDILKSIRTQGITVVVSTPYMDEATRCDRIAMIQEGQILGINTPSAFVREFQGKLYTFSSENIFSLLNIMEQCPLRCNYYPYGEHCHIAFYDDVATALPQFEQFLQEQGQSHGEIIAIDPSVEDCFIEIVQMRIALNQPQP
ncbi:MAG: ABC transporter ATP-binding protein [Bacteroidales bacterium]|nr:ABC transporter ATP-binding protein [Bacteroidales bacterium]